MKFKELDVYAIGDTIQIAGAIYQGEGKTFLCFFPKEKDDLPLEALEMDIDEWKKFLFQTDVLEVAILEKASDGTLAKAIVRKSQRQIDNHMQWAVWRRDQYTCRYCWRNDVPLTVDHLVLWEEGGPTVPENLVSACKKCNKIRGNMQYGDWLKHPYYLRVSKDLSLREKNNNIALLETLPSIPRYVNQRQR
jgi:hypothetical protein